MAKDVNAADYRVGIVGAGAMGQGIAQVSVQGGLHVLLYDAREGGAEAGRAAIVKRLERLVEKGRIGEEACAEMTGRIAVASSLDDFAECDAVVEAVFEDLQVKQELFQALEAIVGDDCILASNTSSLLIASIARVCRRRDRIAGLHFFNPVPLMRLVEVVRGPETGEGVVEALVGLGKRMGRTPVVAKDAPGFIVNHGGRAYTTEAMRILHERVATPSQIDAVMRDCCGFRMGPCELMDLTGVDVNYPVSMIIYEGYDHDPRLKTAFPHRGLLEAGKLGRKTGAGNYEYDEKGRMVDPPSPDFLTGAAPAAGVVLVEPSAQLSAFAEAIGLPVVAKDDHVSPLLAAPVGEDCSALAARLQLDHRRLVAVDLWCDTHKRVTLMRPPGAGASAMEAVAAGIIASGRAVTAIKDSPGFVAQRIRAVVAALGTEMAQIGVADPEEIDTALKLGLNYPLGPLELAEHLGLVKLLGALRRMQEITGEDRYRPTHWLRRRAELGLSIHASD